MTLRFSPAEDHPRKALFLTFFLGFAGSAIHAYVGQLVLTLMLMGLLLFSLRRFFIPTTYQVDEEGLRLLSLGAEQKYCWSRFRSFEKDRNGIFLSPFRERRGLDEVRGIFLPLKPADRDRLSLWLSERLAQRDL